MQLVDQITEFYQDDQLIVSIFWDLQQAFDCVAQFVQIKEKKSELKNAQHGLPQDSVLALLLFLIYINDFDMGLGMD